MFPLGFSTYTTAIEILPYMRQGMFTLSGEPSGSFLIPIGNFQSTSLHFIILDIFLARIFTKAFLSFCLIFPVNNVIMLNKGGYALREPIEWDNCAAV